MASPKGGLPRQATFRPPDTTVFPNSRCPGPIKQKQSTLSELPTPPYASQDISNFTQSGFSDESCFQRLQFRRKQQWSHRSTAQVLYQMHNRLGCQGRADCRENEETAGAQPAQRQGALATTPIFILSVIRGPKPFICTEELEINLEYRSNGILRGVPGH